jgi:hypothetical protein
MLLPNFQDTLSISYSSSILCMSIQQSKLVQGIIVRNDEGKIIHGRNLDFSMWELLGNLAARI